MANTSVDRALERLYDALHEVGAIFSRLGQSRSSAGEETVPPAPPDLGTTPAATEATAQNKPPKGDCHSPTLTDILAAANVSTARSRAMVFVLIGAAMIAFAACWKAFPIGWFHQRVASTIAAIDYLDKQQLDDDLQANKDWILRPFGVGEDPRYAYERQRQHRIETLEQDKHLSKEDREDLWNKHLEKGAANVKARGFVDAKHARAYLDALEQTRIEGVNVLHLPIFGITFDVNDLGIIAGISFIVLLITLRLALSRELQNLRIAFSTAHDSGRLREAYEYLSMSQVMTLPPGVRSRPKRETILSRAPMLLVWCPFVVQLMIFLNDLFTMRLGQVTSIDLTYVSLLLGFSSVFVILILTYMCWHFSGEIDHEWFQAWLNLRRAND